MFVATFATYFPFVGLSEYAAPPARDRDEEAGNEWRHRGFYRVHPVWE